MQEVTQLEQSSTKIPEKESITTKQGYEATIMVHPKTGENLVIRECFDRWQLVEDEETAEEYSMRKRLLNAFNKQTKNRDRLLFKSRDSKIVNNEYGTVRVLSKGVTYIKENEKE